MRLERVELLPEPEPEPDACMLDVQCFHPALRRRYQHWYTVLSVESDFDPSSNMVEFYRVEDSSSIILV